MNEFDGVATGAARPRVTPFSDQQKVILRMASEGLTTREIASVLWLTPATIKYHRAKIIRKLDAQNFPHAVATAIREGIL